MRSTAAALLLCATAVATMVAACQRQPPSAGVPLDRSVTLGGKLVSAAQLTRGAAAYSHYCRACHGEGGHGDGLSARGLNPPPRDLRLGVYKFAAVSTGQLPNDEDFRRIITGGLHGTAMLAWDVPAMQLDDLIQFIKALSPRWQNETPGEPIVMTKDPWTDRESAAIDRGRRVYHGMAQCAVACHPAYATREEIFTFTQELTQMRVEEFRPDLYDDPRLECAKIGRRGHGGDALRGESLDPKDVPAEDRLSSSGGAGHQLTRDRSNSFSRAVQGSSAGIIVFRQSALSERRQIVQSVLWLARLHGRANDSGVIKSNQVTSFMRQRRFEIICAWRAVA